MRKKHMTMYLCTHVFLIFSIDVYIYIYNYHVLYTHIIVYKDVYICVYISSSRMQMTQVISPSPNLRRFSPWLREAFLGRGPAPRRRRAPRRPRWPRCNLGPPFAPVSSGVMSLGIENMVETIKAYHFCQTQKC